MFAKSHTVMTAAVAVLGMVLFFALPARAAELIMVEQEGCVYCEQWDAEIMPIYPKTAESRVAPLRKMDLFDTFPEDVTFARPVNFTPTFVLVEDGVELARIEGYPGEAFFWGLLGRILTQYTSFEDGS
jgi:hypothetical protein